MKIEFDSEPCATQRACAALGAWHVLVGCMMLNKTTRTQARAALKRIFDLVEDPGELADVSDDALLEILLPCGLANRRLRGLRAMTEDWLAGKPVDRMRYVGQYAIDSFRIFVLHEEVVVRDDMDAEIRLFLEERQTKS
jgi:hypothetical protein